MDRRSLLTTASAAALAGLLPGAALAYQSTAYKPGVLKTALRRGDTVILDYFATWCTTCKAQHRVIDELIRENPAYQSEITWILVDWDTYGRADITRRYNVPRRSTLIALKGEKEIGRIVAGTAKGQIKALLDAALSEALG